MRVRARTRSPIHLSGPGAERRERSNVSNIIHIQILYVVLCIYKYYMLRRTSPMILADRSCSLCQRAGLLVLVVSTPQQQASRGCGPVRGLRPRGGGWGLAAGGRVPHHHLASLPREYGSEYAHVRAGEDGIPFWDPLREPGGHYRSAGAVSGQPHLSFRG